MLNSRAFLIHSLLITASLSLANAETDYYAVFPFGTETSYAKDSDETATGAWFEKTAADFPGSRAAHQTRHLAMTKWFKERPRDKALGFCLYTVDQGTLKLTAQCFPLLPKEPKTVILEVQRGGKGGGNGGDKWEQIQQQPLQYPGWSAHFRIENWDHSVDTPYRVRLGDLSSFTGLIRKNPSAKETITVASTSCNSPYDESVYERADLVKNLRALDPDLVFFAGDQSYHHDEHTFGWLQHGVQFAELLKDRPTVCLTDDHDVGHGNLWGESGKASTGKKGATDGGYMYPASFVNMVERCQTYHLPDPYDPTPVKQGIGVYYTSLNIGGISFAILEDRKFKSAPLGNVPEMGPRPDHIKDPAYDRQSVDTPALTLLGQRQLDFLKHWAMDWTDAQMKVALSQTAFCGAVHLHGSKNNRLLADLDSNGWPQTGRNKALRILRQARASHLCGDQHLAVVVQHGIDGYRDGPITFTNPALVNTVYGRWWWPEDEKPGTGTKIDSPLPWTGDYEDGFGNKITMLSYANPEHAHGGDLRKNRGSRGDGFGIARLNKKTGMISFECYPRFWAGKPASEVQYKGWPINFHVSANDSRKPIKHFPEITLPAANMVVALIDNNSGETIYCHRVSGNTFSAPVYTKGSYTLKAGISTADTVISKKSF